MRGQRTWYEDEHARKTLYHPQIRTGLNSFPVTRVFFTRVCAFFTADTVEKLIFVC